MKNKNSLKIILAVLIALCASCASAKFTAPESRYVPYDFFGITPERTPLTEENLALLDEFNAVWIRDTIRWSDVERQEGVWNFSDWDSFIDTAEAGGRKLVLVLGFDNGRLYKNGRERRNFGERELTLFLEYIGQVVNRYGTRVVYEIWNEPNFMYWKGSDERFYAVVKAAVERIKELVPDATVLAGATFRVPYDFIRGLFLAGAMEHTNGLSIHPYGLTPAATMRLTDRLLPIFDEFDYDRPVWITETGYSTGSIFIGNKKRHSELVVKTLSGLAIRSGFTRNLIWYELKDEYNPGEKQNRLDFLNYCGLIYPNGVFKNGAEAYMLTANYLAGSEYIPDYPFRENVGKSVTSLYFRKDNGENIIVIWKNGPGKRKFILAIPGASDITRHNINNREVTRLPQEIILEVNRTPVFITWTGGDPPMLSKF